MIKFKEANKNQLEAIEHISGPLLIIAGPGTGKTFTLINRALNLIVNKKVPASKILFATFTEKAANELITRLSNELEDNRIDFNPNEMYIGTFHSICLRILKDHVAFTSLKKNFKLYDQFDQQYFIYQNFNSFNEIKGFNEMFSSGTFWNRCADVMKYLNRLTEEMVDWHSLIESSNQTDVFFGHLMEKYENLRIVNNFIDFSSIQVETYKLLVSNEDIRKETLDSVDYVMIDEYQDTNHIQEKLAFLFASENNNLCVVGDDDQAIYRFRGATVRNILEFPNHFPLCKKVQLSENYRSHKDIVTFYNKWMDDTKGHEFEFEWGKYRYPKTIISVKPKTTNESCVLQLETKEENYINKKTLAFIHQLMDSKSISDLNQIAFLFRSVKSDQARDLADYLEQNNIPVYSPRSNLFFERDEIMSLIGLLIFIFPSYLKGMGTLKNGIPNPMFRYYSKCKAAAEQILRTNTELFKWVRFRIKDHVEMKSSLNYGYSGLIYQMLAFEPFYSLMGTDMKKGIVDTRSVRNIRILVNLLVKFESLQGVSVLTVKNLDVLNYRLFNTYFRFLMEGGLSEYEDDSDYAPSGCVSFMTIHQSKGLEFPIVIVGSQSSAPRKQYDEAVEMIVEKYSGRGSFEKLNEIKMFDFWRLFYVAFSRAQSLLVLQCDFSKSNEPSKYFEWFYPALPRDSDFSKFKFEKIKSTSLKNSYSFTSDINVYLTCPTQYKFYRELGFEPVRIGSTLFGTVVHETIEDIHKAVLRGDIPSVNEENIAKWMEINYKTASQSTNSFLAEQILKSALEQVMSYVERNASKWDTIKDAEMPITLSEKGFIINGKVDLITNEYGDYQILDFKTEKKPDFNKDRDRIKRVQHQLEIYAYLFEKRYNIKVKGMRAYYTGEKDGVPVISFRKDEKHVKETIQTFRDVVKKIERKDFAGQCGDLKVCKNCDLRHYCKRG